VVDLSAKPSQAGLRDGVFHCVFATTKGRVHHQHTLNNTLRIMEASWRTLDILYFVRPVRDLHGFSPFAPLRADSGSPLGK
jgi:hypothetical protein